jgi:Uma2 family endonuclease
MTPGVDLSIDPTIWLNLDDELQPDAVLLINAAAGGQSRISEDDYIEGAPELIVEIAASSAAIDTGTKKQVYRRNGVREYLVWQSYEQKLDWFHLVAGEYQMLAPDAHGIVRSQVFSGLWLAVNPMLAGDMIRVLAVLQQGIDSPEPQSFVGSLTSQSQD